MLPIVHRKSPSAAPQEARRILTASGVDSWVALALSNRGVEDAATAKGDYRLEHYRSLKGIVHMATLLGGAIIRGDRLMVVADYDCDGATACTLAVSGLRALGANVDFVVPNRFRHGYGLTPSVVDLVAESRPRPEWIITVDNGIASNAGVAHANHLGIKVLVTDHHLPGPEIPDAAAIVNPNQPGCAFPSKHLAGCGVMYYVLAATRDFLAAKGQLRHAPDLGNWLDVVALGTVADVVRLDPNNRWMIRRGLARIRTGQTRPGISALFEVSNRNPTRASAQDFGFSLGPRINAAGRLDDMSIGIRCLLSNDEAHAQTLAEELFELNETRKDIERTMKEEAWTDLDLSGQDGCFTRVVYGPEFHEGVIGIVGGRIKEECHTPVVVFANAQEDGYLKGSGRSIPGVHLRDALDLVHKRGGELLHKFGGHAMAAGLTMKKENLDRFTSLFEQAVREMQGGELQQKTLLVDGELPDEALNADTAEAFSREVWGQGFEEPIWMGDFKIVESRLVGKDQNHLKMVVERNGRRWNAMQFFCEEAPPNGEVSLAYRLGYNEFQGRRSADLMVVDRR